MNRDDYVRGLCVELVGDLNAMLALPRVTDDEWEQKYKWIEDENGDCGPVSDTEENRAMLASRHPTLVWSAIDDPTGENETLIVPGYWPRAAYAWYLTEKPWDPNHQEVGVVPHHDDD